MEELMEMIKEVKFFRNMYGVIAAISIAALFLVCMNGLYKWWDISLILLITMGLALSQVAVCCFAGCVDAGNKIRELSLRMQMNRELEVYARLQQELAYKKGAIDVQQER